MRLALAAAASLLVFLPAPLAGQETEFGAVDPTRDIDINVENECEPWPACYINPPSGAPTGGGGGIIAASRAPGFETDGSWGALEINEEAQQFILRPSQEAPQEYIWSVRPHELPR